MLVFVSPKVQGPTILHPHVIYVLVEQKLTVMSHKAEMKRKLVVVTPDIYNNLDLLVGSKEFSQVIVWLTGSSTIATIDLSSLLWLRTVIYNDGWKRSSHEGRGIPYHTWNLHPGRVSGLFCMV